MEGKSFLVCRPEGDSTVFEITQPALKIGRAADNDIVLADTSRSISRFHAQITLDPAGLASICDLKSANGTFVNERTVEGLVKLAQGDVVRIGPYRLVYRDGTTVAPKVDEQPSQIGFQIETAAVDLHELQSSPQLLRPSDVESSPQLRALELLHEVGVRLARTATESDVVDTAVDLLFNIEGVQRATLMSWDEDQQAFRQAALYARGGKKMTDRGTPASFDPRSLVLSKTILRKVREENRPLHIRDARSHSELGQSASIIRAGIQAAFCSPLTFQNRFLGVLYADNLLAPDAFSPDDFRIFTTIAAQTGLALASSVTRGELIKREVEQAAMRLYLSPQVADLITAGDGRVELGGVLQPVTALFADIRNFTHLSEELDAREVVLLLNEFFTVMTEVILEAGGTLDKYIGDCVMALFGAPLPAGDDVQRALQAAANMQREVVQLNLSRKQRGLGEIYIGVGVHSGRAVVGNVGSAQRMQYTAIGDTVNVAARLVNLAKPNQIIVSEDIRNIAGATDAFQPLGEVQLKGRQQKMNIYSMQWENR
jgi:adenylate cyclase